VSTIAHLINGELVQQTGRSTPVFNPSLGKPVRSGPGRPGHHPRRHRQRQGRLPGLAQTPPAKRAQVMFRFKQLLEANRDKIAQLISEEHGKTLEDAVGELQRGIENVEYACGVPELLKGEYNRNVGPNIDSWSDFQPLGVVAGITPFNFPAMVPLWMYPLAIACGNCFILKPSERDPSSTL
jgi:malonate-semialdehyde dehydrogenase (acetylating)/methylmalonate-semialdehyde dehydrogenase